MGARYPLLFLILLLLHGANAYPPVPEWLTLNGKHLAFYGGVVNWQVLFPQTHVKIFSFALEEGEHVLSACILVCPPFC
jgi:hypothetical protein